MRVHGSSASVAHVTHVAVALEISGIETVACGYLILTYPKFEPCVHTVIR